MAIIHHDYENAEQSWIMVVQLKKITGYNTVNFTQAKIDIYSKTKFKKKITTNKTVCIT